MSKPPPPRDPTARFFEMLAVRDHEELLRKANGCTRFDIVAGRKTDRWFVTIDNGDIVVTRQPLHADCVLRADRAVFDKVAGGKLNAVAAVLRGDLEVEGDWRLLVRMQRLFPSPRSSRRKRVAA
jgi:putative sterol carrier protein